MNWKGVQRTTFLAACVGATVAAGTSTVIGAGGEASDGKAIPCPELTDEMRGEALRLDGSVAERDQCSEAVPSLESGDSRSEGEPQAQGGLAVGKNWRRSLYRGASLAWRGTYTRCQTTNYVVPSMYSLAGARWNNSISSSKGFGTCDRFKHFANTRYRGDKRVCRPRCRRLGGLNNRTSSAKLKWQLNN